MNSWFNHGFAIMNNGMTWDLALCQFTRGYCNYTTYLDDVWKQRIHGQFGDGMYTVYIYIYTHTFIHYTYSCLSMDHCDNAYM